MIDLNLDTYLLGGVLIAQLIIIWRSWRKPTTEMKPPQPIRWKSTFPEIRPLVHQMKEVVKPLVERFEHDKDREPGNKRFYAMEYLKQEFPPGTSQLCMSIAIDLAIAEARYG